MQTETLTGGFTDPARQSAQTFRSIMEAMARPGTIHKVYGATPPEPLSRAAGAVVLTLCDTDTPVHLAGAADCEAVHRWLAFHTGAPITGPADAMFAIGTWEALWPMSQYSIGTSIYPDRSATLIVECPVLSASGAALTGPGIKDTAHFSLPETQALQDNRALFPLGLDFIFASGDDLAALPRSTHVAAPNTAQKVR